MTTDIHFRKCYTNDDTNHHPKINGHVLMKDTYFSRFVLVLTASAIR